MLDNDGEDETHEGVDITDAAAEAGGSDGIVTEGERERTKEIERDNDIDGDKADGNVWFTGIAADASG